MIKSVTVIADNATPELKRVMDRLSTNQLAQRVGTDCRELTEIHLSKLGKNKKGWPSTGFYEKFAKRVRALPDGKGVAILILPADINDRVVSFRQRYYGGPIAPITAKALAIPINPVSYGHVPSDFPGMDLIKTSKGMYLVQQGEQKSAKTGKWIRRGKGAGGNKERRVRASLTFLFKLFPSVNQAPDPSVLPTDEQYIATAKGAILKGLNR